MSDCRAGAEQIGCKRGIAPASLFFGGQEYVIADPAMVAVHQLLRRLAISQMPVLITGETGVGKEHVARALHSWSNRAQMPLVVLNCAAIAESLVESELFGHCKGAFTGATEAKRGLLETANGGTIFLDEIGELSPGAQAKLLRAIEEGRLRPVGGLSERPVDVRLLAATNRDLGLLMKQGTFRKDLYYRLSGAVVTVPALRDRPHDIIALAHHFLAGACRTLGRSDVEISTEAERLLLDHRWEGNVRELRNLMESVAATCDGQRMERRHLISHLVADQKRPAPTSLDVAECGFGTTYCLSREIEDLEQRRIREAMDAAHGVQVHAARLLDMPLRTLINKLRKYGVQTAKRRAIELGARRRMTGTAYQGTRDEAAVPISLP